MQRRPPRRRVLRSVAAVGALLASLVAGPVAAADDAGSPADGAVTRLSQGVPNYFALADPKSNPAYCPSQCPDTQTTATLFADPVNHLLFETDIGDGAPSSLHCLPGLTAPLLALDEDSFAPRAFGCGGAPPAGAVHTDVALVAVDSADHLLFFSGNESSYAPTVAVNAHAAQETVVAVSEDTLRPVAQWTLPATTAGGTTPGAPAPPDVMGLAWQASGDRLVVETGYGTEYAAVSGSTGPPPGVDIAVYDIKATLAQPGSGDGSVGPVPAVPADDPSTSVYPYAVPGCTYAMSLNSFFATANPFLNADGTYLFVPCYIQGSIDGGNGAAAAVPAGIVRLDLKNLAPAGASTPTVLPGNQDGDVIFDAGSTDDRAYVPVQTNSGTIIYVYSGALAKLIGENAVVSEPPGVQNPDNNCVDMALNPATGRFYGLAPTGLFFFDARRTSIAGGQQLDEFSTFVQYETDVVLPADDVYPYPRVLLAVKSPPSADTTATDCPDTGNWTVKGFAVFADRTSPPATGAGDNPDTNTYDGDIPAGIDTSVSFGSNATAGGAHVDWAGSYGGAVNNLTGATGVNAGFFPLGGDIRDLLAGWVNKSSISNGSATAAATAVGDGNTHTAGDLASCTNLSALDGCPHPAPPEGFPSPPSPPGGGSNTGQAWPAGTAACPLPSATGQQNQSTASGLDYTTGYDENNRPEQAAIPGTDQIATASVDCAPHDPVGGATASASIHGVASATPGGPGVQVANVSSSTTNWPAVAGGPAVSQATSVARGVHVDDGAGSALQIGFIEQTATTKAAGRPGTAQATRSVVIGDVSVTRPDEDPQVYCEGICRGDPQSVIAQINAALPAYMQVSLPDPWSPFGPVTTSGTTQTIPGSPGGYQAQVAPSPADQATNAGLFGYPTSDGESALLPALRVLFTPVNLQKYQLDYLVVDLAPLETDSFAGVTVTCPDGSYAPDPALPLNCVQFPAFDSGLTADTGAEATGTTPVTAGTPPVKGHFVPGAKAHYVPATKGHFVPGTPASQPSFVPARVTQGAPLTQALLQPQQPPLLAGGVPQLLKRVFHGFRLLARSPAEAAKFFGLLVLLALPMVMAARRRQWSRAIEDV